MRSEDSNLNTGDSEADFRRLLLDVKEDKASVAVLLDDPVFTRRLRVIVRALAQTAEAAEELANDVRLKVWRDLPEFTPDYESVYGNFFRWLSSIARNTYLDTLRRRQVKLDEQPIDNLDIVDPQMDIESSFLFKEVMAEFEKTINALPERERLAIAYYLQGFSSREISEKMLGAGVSVSHVTILKWTRDALATFFHNRGHLENIRSKNVRTMKVRATRAKREFHTILEHAINAGTPDITSEKTYRKSRAHVTNRKTPRKTQPTLRPDWQTANDLLKKMQSPESKQGISAAFEAPPEALGIAAIEHANKGRKVPVGSLTTYLMATSTANVVGKVMNLTKDVT
jgi:RNA polymerase sigma factor (sigma-70 family)